MFFTCHSCSSKNLLIRSYSYAPPCLQNLLSNLFRQPLQIHAHVMKIQHLQYFFIVSCQANNLFRKSCSPSWTNKLVSVTLLTHVIAAYHIIYVAYIYTLFHKKWWHSSVAWKNADRLTQLNTNTRPTNGITITAKVSKSNYWLNKFTTVGLLFISSIVLQLYIKNHMYSSSVWWSC